MATETDTPVPTDGDADLVDVEGIVFVKTGWVRFTIDGKVYRLRRPLFGELKKLRLALEDVSDDINTRSAASTQMAIDLEREAQAVASSESTISAAKRRSLEAKRLESRKLGRDLVEFADDARMGWWTLVFETLGVGDGQGGDKIPADWPAWVVDVNLPGQITQHWRSAPLAPGR